MSENVKISLTTGISVFVTLCLGGWLEVDSLFYASIAAAVVSQTCYREVFRLGLKRVYGTLVGAVAGILFYNYLPHENIYYALGIVMIVFICSALIGAPANMACIVFLAVSTNLEDVSGEYYTMHRVTDTCLGVVSALTVALVFKVFEKRKRETP